MGSIFGPLENESSIFWTGKVETAIERPAVPPKPLLFQDL
jgi:hypothetical protein